MPILRDWSAIATCVRVISVCSAKGEQRYKNGTGVRPEGDTTLLLFSQRGFVKCCPKTLWEVGWATKDMKEKESKESKPGVAAPIQPNSRASCHSGSQSSNPGSHFCVDGHLLDCWPAHLSPAPPPAFSSSFYSSSFRPQGLPLGAGPVTGNLGSQPRPCFCYMDGKGK